MQPVIVTPGQEEHRAMLAAARKEAILWAQRTLEAPFLVLDSETTGMADDDQIIQLAIIDSHGQVKFNSLFRPSVEVKRTALAVHGLGTQTLERAPTMVELYSTLQKVLYNKTVMIYNADFDVRLLGQTLAAFNLPPIHFNAGCIMHPFAKFKGEWVDRRKSFKWPQLVGGDHSALGDCRAALRTIMDMAKASAQ